jgi:hypothetical protein
MHNNELAECHHRKQFFICLLSLLLHLLILFLLFYTYQSQKHIEKVKRTELAKKTDTPVLLFSKEEPPPLEWASTNPSKGMSSRPSISAAQPAPVSESMQRTDTDHHKIPQQGVPETLPDLSDIAKDIQITQSTVPDTKTAETKTEDATILDVLKKIDPVVVPPAPAVADAKKYSDFAEASSDRPALAKREPIKIYPKSPITEQKKVAMAAPPPTSAPQAARPPIRQAAITPQAQRMMERIASSFMHAARDEQEHVITIIGDPRRLPTADQIKRERYLAKLQECFHTSCATLRSQFPHITERPTEPIISMKVHRDGSVSNITVIKPSNNAAVDQFYHTIFLDASRSFPPLPPHFPRDFYIFQWIISTYA